GRASREDATYVRVSEDLGATWGPWSDISGQVGVVQQPNLVKFEDTPGTIYLLGRRREKETAQRNGIWWTDDLGATWKGGVLDEKDFIDTGYGDMALRRDGHAVYIAYRGRDDWADVFSYIFPLPIKAK